MLLNDFWWEVGYFYLSDSEAWRSHIRISRILGFTGCYWMIVFWKLGIFNCLNQDFQDLQDVIG
jgi:hypothetical protein